MDLRSKMTVKNVQRIVRVLIAFVILLWLAHAALAAVATSYFAHLQKQKCACAETGRAKALQAVSAAYLGVAPLFIGLLLFRDRRPVQTMYSIASLMHFGLLVAFLYFAGSYLTAIREEQCACARDDPRWKYLRAWFWLWIAQISLALLLPIVLILVIKLTAARKA